MNDSDSSSLMFVWHADGTTIALPFCNDLGETTPLIEEMAAALVKHAGSATAPLIELYRGVAGERMELITDLRAALTQKCKEAQEAGELAEAYRANYRQLEEAFGLSPLGETS